MWAKPVTIVAPAEEPISLAQAKQFLRLDEDEVGFDDELALHVAGARGRVESVTGTRLIHQTVQIRADSFSDLDLLPIGPIASLIDISYVDTAGDVQSLDLDTVEIFGDELEMGIRPVSGTWSSLVSPHFRGGRVTVRAIVGYGADGDAIPASVRTGLLLQVRALFDDTIVDLDPWIVNDRIWL